MNEPAHNGYRPKEYWSARLSSEFNLRGTGHICYSEGYNRWLYRAKARVLRRGLRGLPRPARALDIGSGSGWVVDQLLAWGADVEGCDVAEVAVERLRQTRPAATFFAAEWGKAPLPRPDSSFDLVTLLDVAYHVVDDDQWADPAPHVRFRARTRWEDAARRAGLVPVAVMRYVSWLSRPREAPGFGWMSDIVRSAVEYGLEVVAPRPAHLRGAVFVRQR